MKKSIKLSIVFVILVALCMLFTVIASAEAYTVQYNTNDTKKTTVSTDENGQITLRTDKYSNDTATYEITDIDGNKVNVSKEFYGWYDIYGNLYEPGATITITENLVLREAYGFEVYNITDLVNYIKSGWRYIRLGTDLTTDTKMSINSTGNGHYACLDLNGHSITSTAEQFFSSPRNGLMILGEGKLIHNSPDEEKGVFYYNNYGGYNAHISRLWIGKDVTIETNGTFVYMDSSFGGITNPFLSISGNVTAKYFIKTRSIPQAICQIKGDATVTISSGSLINNISAETALQTTLYIYGGTIDFPQDVDYLSEIKRIRYEITGGAFVNELPDEIMRDGYDCVYNEETGLYDVKFVPCTLQDSNGTHNFVAKESYGGEVSTCEGLGVYYFRCDCGDYYVDIVDSLGHSYDILVSETPATCFAKAYKTCKCIRCDSTANLEYGNALGHDYSIVKITKTATATENGTKLFICSRCDCYENGVHTDYDEANPSTTCSHGCYYEDYSFDASDVLIELVVKDGDTNKTVIVKVSDVYTITDGVFGAIKTFTDPSDSTKTYNASSIVKLVIPTGVTSIPAGAINSMSSLEEIYFSEGANATLAQKSIDSCANLKKIVAENCTLVFEQYTVNSCSNLATIDISKANATFKSNAFRSFTAVKHLLMSSGHTYNFGTFAFASSGLEEVILPDDSTVTLSQKSFAETTTIKYVYIGKNCISTKTSDGKIALGDNGNNGAYSIFGGNAVLSKVVMMDIEYVAKWVFSVKTSGSYAAKNDIYIYSHADLLEFNTTDSAINDRNTYKVYIYAKDVVSNPTNCSYVLYKGIPHMYTEGGSEPTCTAQGSTAYTTDCPCGIVSDATYTVEAYSGYTGDTTGGTISVGEVKPANGHDFDPVNGATIVETNPATCLRGGTITYKCVNCDETTTQDNPDDPQREHNIEGVEFDIITPAACITDGLQNKLCKDCKLLVVSEVIPATGHDIDGVEYTQGVAPTCTLAGTNVKLCNTCGEIAESQSVNALGHTEGEFATALDPDCDDDGVKEKRCTVCNALIATQTIAKLGHDYNLENGATIIAISYPDGFDKTGKQSVKCVRCTITSDSDSAPILLAKGYSTNDEHNALNGGYAIDIDLLAQYKSLNGEITFGIVIANANKFGNNSFFDAKNKVNTEKALQIEINETVYTNFDCSINFGSASNNTLELIICAYVIDEKGNPSFIQAENDYAIEATIGSQTFTKVTLDRVVENVVSQPDASLPTNDEE